MSFLSPARIDGIRGGLTSYLEPEAHGDEEVLFQSACDGAKEELLAARFHRLTSLQPAEELELRPGPEQDEVMDAPRPLLLQGPAGSGKTTLLVYMALRRLAELRASGVEPGPREVLLVVYNDALLRFTTGLLRTLLGGLNLPLGLDVLTWRGLCDHLAAAVDLPPFKWLEDLERVNQTLRLLRRDGGIADEIGLHQMQEEIRAVIKGQQCDPSMPMLSQAVYLSLQAGRDVHARASWRRVIFKGAKAYQRYLKDRGLVDDMDAARALIAQRGHLPHWRHVLVDEVQDYTQVQCMLLASLSEHQTGLVFAGDTDQVIYPSAFQWKRVKDAVYARRALRALADRAGLRRTRPTRRSRSR